MKNNVNYDSIRCNFPLPFEAKRGFSKLTYYTIISNDSSSYEISRRGVLWKIKSFGSAEERDPLFDEERVKMSEFSGRIFFSGQCSSFMSDLIRRVGVADKPYYFSDCHVEFSAIFDCGRIQGIELIKFELIKFDLIKYPNKSPEIAKTSKIKSFINKYISMPFLSRKFFLVSCAKAMGFC